MRYRGGSFMDYFSSFPNRTICDVFEEMRKCNESRNFTPIIGLIEEAQSLANRMEAGLNDKKDVENWTVKRQKLKKEIKELIKRKKKLKEEVGDKEDDSSEE